MRNFMLRLIGMYIPFVLVILGIGACSFIYKDNLLGTFGQQEEVIEPVPNQQEEVIEPVPEPEPEVPTAEIVTGKRDVHSNKT